MSLRVGMLTYGLDRPTTGIGRYTHELARALHILGGDLQVRLLTAGNSGPFIGGDFRCFNLPGCRRLPGLLTLGNLAIPWLARRLGLDLIHDPTGVTPLLFGAGGAQAVVTVHDVFTWSCPGTSTWLDTLIYRYWLPRVWPKADLVITVSQASKADIVRFLGIPAAKIRVIYEGVGNTYQAQSEAEIECVRLKHRLPDRYILFVGSVEKRKNLSGLLQAYASLRRANHVPHLVIVGAAGRKGVSVADIVDGPDLEDFVRRTGYVPESDLPALYSGAEMFVFPSLYEGFGLPPLEAMACGTPVVCSNAASLPEVVGDAAVTVDPYDVDALADAMHRVLTDPELREDLRAQGLERARQFTWERTARETLAVYREVCGA